MGYYIDLEAISLDTYHDKLSSSPLVPSRRLLKENISEHFSKLKNIGMQNVSDVLKNLKTKGKIEHISRETGIEEQYLTILAREARSMLAKPVRLIDFPDLLEADIQKLHLLGIKNTPNLYDRILTIDQRKTLCHESGLSHDFMLKLAQLTDLTRIRWVNHTFAYMLYETGYKTVADVARADPEDLYKVINDINQLKGFYKGKIGLNDMKLCVLAARDVEPEIEI